MRKFALLLGAAAGALMLIYGALSALVNKGYSLPAALVLLLVIAGGTAALIWFVRSDPAD